MNCSRDGNTLRVTLSRRNLGVMLAKLDDPDSARTIYRECDDGTVVILQAEDDAEHYGDRTPGIMAHAPKEAIQ